MALPKDKELILEKHCPSMSLLYLDDMGRAFRKRILAAMEEYADAKVIEEIDSDHLVIIGRLKEELRDKTDQAQNLVEALEQIAESNCDYESVPIAGKLHKPDCRACKAKAVLLEHNAVTPDRPCPHCGKELNRDRNLCCRECGEEVEG